MIPFPSREEAKAYKEKADEVFKNRGQYEFSKILARNLDKYDTPHWL